MNPLTLRYRKTYLERPLQVKLTGPLVLVCPVVLVIFLSDKVFWARNQVNI